MLGSLGKLEQLVQFRLGFCLYQSLFATIRGCIKPPIY